MKKRILSVIFGIIIFATLISGCSGSDSNSGIGAKGISVEEFDKISIGMKLSDVKDIVGGEGSLVSETKDEQDEYNKHTYVYKFEGENTGYAELEFTKTNYKDIMKMDFSDPKLTSKTKYDLS